MEDDDEPLEPSGAYKKAKTKHGFFKRAVSPNVATNVCTTD
jgi:hypothetical protein